MIIIYHYSAPHSACPTPGDAEHKSRILELIINELHGTLLVCLVYSVFGLRNKVIHLLLTPHFFIWFVE
jgi:hypothetical protein